MYKLVKGSLTKERFDKAGIDELLEKGFELIGDYPEEKKVARKKKASEKEYNEESQEN